MSQPPGEERHLLGPDSSYQNLAFLSYQSSWKILPLLHQKSGSRLLAARRELTRFKAASSRRLM